VGKFTRIVLFARHRHDTEETQTTLRNLHAFLLAQKIAVRYELQTAKVLGEDESEAVTFEKMQACCDLLIIVGGDGSLLSAARAAVKYDIPVLGVNRGRLGFLTDIHPDEINTKLQAILDGKYQEEPRFLLDGSIQQGSKLTPQADALNDIVLLAENAPNMMEFEIHINDKFVCHQRGDGLIVATPTGSTAYALSGGGPILHPTLDAIVIVAMFPHTFSSRPIVVEGNSEITLVMKNYDECQPCLSYDGQSRVAISPDDTVHIKKKQRALRLIHPLDYNYYEALRSKLGWEAKHYNHTLC